MRANVYIDAFNLYYGCLKGTPYRWLDLGAFARRLVSKKYQLHRIRYFTAHVRPRPSDPDQLKRQLAYLRALGTIPNVSIHLGHFLTSTVRRPLAHPVPGGPKTVEVIKTEEKGSDVNLATLLLVDAFGKDFDMAVVITNDSDLCLPIETVRKDVGLAVGVINPQKYPSQALKKVATFVRKVRPGDLKACQFPATLTDSRGTITKPSAW